MQLLHQRGWRRTVLLTNELKLVKFFTFLPYLEIDNYTSFLIPNTAISLDELHTL